MVRGTTPKLKFPIPVDEEMIEVGYVTFNQGNETLIEKDKDSWEFEEKKIIIHLSQEETLLLKEESTVEIQIRFRTKDGEAFAQYPPIKTSVGRILKMVSFNAQFSCDEMTFSTNYSCEENSFTTNFGMIQEVEREAEIYTGETLVIPDAQNGKVLETANKKVMSDITITKVPYYETSNVSGGETVYIASGVEY